MLEQREKTENRKPMIREKERIKLQGKSNRRDESLGKWYLKTLSIFMRKQFGFMPMP